MKELIPVLLLYIQRREVLGGQVVLAAHNARRFVVPFLREEFRRCSFGIPDDRLFLDTRSTEFETVWTKSSRKLTLQALGEFYGIPSEGQPHRAKSDVNLLLSVLANIFLTGSLIPVTFCKGLSRPRT